MTNIGFSAKVRCLSHQETFSVCVCVLVTCKRTRWVAHLEGWSSGFCASGRSEWCSRTPAHHWIGRKPLAPACDDLVSSDGPLPSELDPAWIKASLLHRMSSPLLGCVQSSPSQMLTLPLWLPYRLSVGVQGSQMNKELAAAFILSFAMMTQWEFPSLEDKHVTQDKREGEVCSDTLWLIWNFNC